MAEPGSTILPEHLAQEIVGSKNKSASPAGAPVDLKALGNGGLRGAIGGYEAAMIEGALEKLNWNQTKTAAELKISRRTLIEKMQRYDLRRVPAFQLRESSHAMQSNCAKSRTIGTSGVGHARKAPSPPRIIFRPKFNSL